MKPWIVIASLFVNTIVFAQTDEHFLSYRDGFKIYGFIDGKRLDSIDAQYATISWYNNSQISFDYGQYRDRKKNILVKDQQRVVFELEGYNVPFMLNFMYYNGWEVQQIIPEISTTGTNISSQNNYLLKKRHL